MEEKKPIKRKAPEKSSQPFKKRKYEKYTQNKIKTVNSSKKDR